MLNFDELYKLNQKEDISHEQYFSEMELPEDEIEERISNARKLEEIFKFAFSYMLVAISLGNDVSVEYLTIMLTERYMDIVGNNEDEFNYIVSYIMSDIVNTTLNHSNSEYYFSDMRARIIARTEANRIGNHKLQVQAIKNGYKLKMWNTMKDMYVRHTHVEADNQIVDINKPFNVGNSQLMFPTDTSLGADASEIVNCRCVCTYL